MRSAEERKNWWTARFWNTCLGIFPSLAGFPSFSEVGLSVFYSSIFFFLFFFFILSPPRPPLCISWAVSTTMPLTTLCFIVQQFSLLMTVCRVNLLTLMCQGIWNVINGNYVCQPVMHQMKPNPFKPGWLPLHIVFHLCQINVFGGGTIPWSVVPVDDSGIKSAFGCDKFTNRLDKMSESDGHFKANSTFRDMELEVCDIFTYCLRLALSLIKILLFQVIFMIWKF